MNINMQDYWYSPGYVIRMAEELTKIYGQNRIDKDTHNFKKVGEMKAAAILLLALHKVLGQHFFMQASRDEFPDVWTLYQEQIDAKIVDTKYQTVEVVTYERHTDLKVVDFILESKLINPKKSYDEETIILCYIRNFGTLVDFDELYGQLNRHKFVPSRVFIVGNTLEDPNIFRLSQVWPEVHNEFVDYVEETKAYPLPHRMFFKKGITKTVDYSLNRGTLHVDPYVVFYIDREKIKNP